MNDRPALCIFVQDLRSSGVVRNAISYASGLGGRFHTTLVAGCGDGLWGEEAGRAGVPLVVLGTAPARLKKIVMAWRLRCWLRERLPAVLLSMGNFGHPTVFLATRGLRDVRRIYRISNEIRLGSSGDRLRLIYLRALARDAAGLALVGQRIGADPLFAPAITAGRAVVMSNGVDLARAKQLAAAPSPHAWFEDDIPVVIAIGRLRHQKNHALLVRAIGIARVGRRLRLVVLGGAGSSEAYARLRAIADEGGWAHDLLLAGETDNVFAWLARAALFMLPSRHEGSSMALLEALAVGTAVVATRTAGDAAAVLGNGKYGVLVDGDDPAGLAAAILRQLSPDRVMPGERAQDFGLQATISRYGDLIARAAAGRGP